MSIPADLRYSSDHEWVRVSVENGQTLATVGITHYAQDALGDIVFVQLPDGGISVVSGKTFSEIESTKSVSDVYAPLSGIVVAVNLELQTTPDLLNADPYGAGWICKIAIEDLAEIDSLMDADGYKAFIGS